MTEPNYADFYRMLATIRVRLRDPEPLDDMEREALLEILNSFEEMMNGTRTLMERMGQFKVAIDDLRDARPGT